MTTAIRRRRGTTTEHTTFTGLEGEVTVDTTKDTLVVHDGSTAGGHPLAKAADTVNLTGNQTVAGVKTFSSDQSVNGLTVGRGAGAVSSNTAVGASALAANSTGSGIVAIGNLALTSSTTASNLTAVGWSALKANTTGPENSAFGLNALFSNTTGGQNVAVGQQALQANTTASNNTAVGYQAGYSQTTAPANSCFGYKAGYAQTTGGTYGANTFIGAEAGLASTGDINTFVGAGSGYLVTSGARNTIIGAYSGNQDGLDIRTASNYAVISDGDGNRLLTTANGQTLALDGGAVPNAGTGITFPATQNASSNANTLDDYEEGTWTPTITSGYTSITYQEQTGWYRKVGSLVVVSGKIQFSGTANSAAVLCNAPFTMGAAGYGGGGIPYSDVAVITNTDPYINQNTAEVRFYTKGTGAQINSSGNVTTSYISFVISYYV
jgi:hypothetical protein